jgi:hypothetical protein
MVDQFIGTIAYFAVSLFGGFISSWMKINSTGEAFDPRKHANALITGTVLGLILTIGSLVLDAFDQMSDAAFAILLFVTFVGAAGFDRLRSDGNKSIARNALSLIGLAKKEDSKTS